MSDEKIISEMEEFILNEERKMLEMKYEKEQKKQKDLVSQVLSKLDKEVSNED